MLSNPNHIGGGGQVMPGFSKSSITFKMHLNAIFIYFVILIFHYIIIARCVHLKQWCILAKGKKVCSCIGGGG